MKLDANKILGSERFICRICKKELGSRRALKRHMDALHDGAPIDILEEDV